MEVQFDGVGVSSVLGGASSKSHVEPQRWTAQSGASRSVSPETARRLARLCDRRKRRSVVASWYLSPKTVEGRVRYVCRAQVASFGAGGRSSAACDIVIDIVGWRPVGWENETL